MNEMCEGALFTPLAQFGERVWWMPLQPSNRRLGPLDSRFEQGLGPMEGSNTVLMGTASGVVKARTIKRLPLGERWTGTLLDEALGSELTPNALEDDGGRVGIREPVLQPHAAVPLPPLTPEVRQVRRALLRRTDFEQFGYTDNCPGCANARAGRKQAVDHSEQCRCRMETILSTTTEGHERQERARDRFVQAAKELEDEEPRRKRHRPEGEGRQPLASPGEGGSSSSGSSSGSALPPAPPPAPPPLEPPPLAKRSLEQETEMTDATVQQRGELKRRREHPEEPQTADSISSSRSSSSESSTDTEMGLLDVCTILCGNAERVKGKPVAVTEGREGGLTTLDLTKWDFNKAHRRNKCRELIENSKPLLLIGSPIDCGRENKERALAVLHLAFIICTKHNCTGVGISFTHTHILQTVSNSQTVTDRSLFGPNVPTV